MDTIASAIAPVISVHLTPDIFAVVHIYLTLAYKEKAILCYI